MGIIYIHKNYKDNYKIYIGQTMNDDIEKRWRSGNGYLGKKKDKSEQGWHYVQPRMAEAVLNSDWEKDWDHDVLEYLGNCTQEELDNREAYWISFFDSTNPLRGYNKKPKSKGHGVWSEEDKKRFSEANKGKEPPNKGKQMSEKQKKKISESWKTRDPMSEKTKKKLSESLKEYYKNNPMTDEYKNKVSESLKGHSVSDETKKKMSESHKGKTQTEESKKKISEMLKGKPRPHKGHPISEETKKKISEAHKRRKNEL